MPCDCRRLKFLFGFLVMGLVCCGKTGTTPIKKRELNVVVVGLDNAGKTTIVNNLIGGICVFLIFFCCYCT